MIAEHVFGKVEKNFRWRAVEVTRLEGFSDAVFAFALTLLVVSLEVPKSYDELIKVMKGFVAFGVCFALLAQVWVSHHRYFRRYGLQDGWAIFLNCVLLFVVLFYVYPLKFLWFSGLTGEQIGVQEVRILLVIYGAGYAAVFLVFALLYQHAWKKRDELELNALERLKTKQSLADHIALALIGLVSVSLALLLPSRWVVAAGYFYFIIGVYFTLSGGMFGRQESRLKGSMNAGSAGSAEGAQGSG